MNAADLINDLRALGVELWVEDDRLCFDAPTGALSPALRRELGNSKHELLQLLAGSGPPNSSAPAPLHRVDRESTMPTGFAQRQLWFLDKLAPHGTEYNVVRSFRVNGLVDVAILERSLLELLRRHEALRTCFEEVDGEPVQRVVDAPQWQLIRDDLSALAPADREAQAIALAEAEYNTPFDLGVAPLLRARLTRIDEREHVLVLAMHHIVCDAWSVGVLLQELGTLYAACAGGGDSPLDEPTLHYCDFAAWQHQAIRSGAFEAQRNYWRERLHGVTPLDLPADRLRPDGRSSRGARIPLNWSKALSQDCARLARESHASMFMVLTAVFAAFLHRYARIDDLVIGSPVANRNRPELEGLVGFFLNTLALRVDLGDDPTFGQLVERVRDLTIEAQTNQDLPFELVVRDAAPQREVGSNPLFQVMLAYDGGASHELDLAGLRVTPMPLENSSAKFDLLLDVQTRAGNTDGFLEYNTDLFDRERVLHMAAHLRTLLKKAVRQPQLRVSQLPLMDAKEHDETLNRWNATRVDYPRGETVLDLFAAQAARTPDKEAVVFASASLSYADLDARARALAAHLRSVGAGADSLVAICLQPGVELAVAVLGVLKAGAGYLPLEPGLPPVRLAQMLDDAPPVAILTDREQHLPEITGVIVRMDDDAAFSSLACAEPLAHTPDERDMAYVLFTSGSTGVPKGTALEHRSLVNLIRWQRDNFAIHRDARTLQFSPLGFDVSFQEIFSTWCSGGTLVMMPTEYRRDPAAILGLLRDFSVERLFLPFAALQPLAEAAQRLGAPPALREIMTAGEQLQITPAVRDLMTQLDRGVLHNQYGPTEAHVVTCHTLEGDPDEWPKLPPIGRPISNTRIHILDVHLQPVPIGVPGELHIGGVCLARGYLQRPELNAERFIADPFSDGDAKLYRTGDLARRLADGTIEYLGRMDQQIKLHGHRIEPGEIEAVLGEHPLVRQCVAVCREDTPGLRRLVAYIVTHGPETDENRLWAELRQHARTRLPHYMLPSTFVHLDAFPLTRSQKVDRLALPAPATDERNGTLPPAAPRTALESQIANIWAQLLGVGSVGVDENLFDLGGHSLLATRIVSRIHNAFGAEVSLMALLREPTVATCAALVEVALGESTPITRSDPDSALPVSFAQERLWLVDQMASDAAAYNIALFFDLHGELDRDALGSALQQLVMRHEVLRTVIEAGTNGKDQGESVSLHQRVLTDARVDLPVEDLQDTPIEQREQLLRRRVEAEVAKPFDLATGPVFRARLIRLDPQHHTLLMTVHHAAVDGWSLGVIFREMGEIYRARLNDEQPKLPTLPVRYTDFAIWQRRQMSGARLEKEIAWWRETLHDLPVFGLATD